MFEPLSIVPHFIMHVTKYHFLIENFYRKFNEPLDNISQTFENCPTKVTTKIYIDAFIDYVYLIIYRLQNFGGCTTLFESITCVVVHQRFKDYTNFFTPTEMLPLPVSLTKDDVGIFLVAFTSQAPSFPRLVRNIITKYFLEFKAFVKHSYNDRR